MNQMKFYTDIVTQAANLPLKCKIPCIDAYFTRDKTLGKVFSLYKVVLS